MRIPTRSASTIGVLALAASASSHAAGPGGLYFGGAVGYSYMGLQGQANENAGGGFNTNAVGFSVAVGGYFKPWLGWEASLLRFGEKTEPVPVAASSET